MLRTAEQGGVGVSDLLAALAASGRTGRELAEAIKANARRLAEAIQFTTAHRDAIDSVLAAHRAARLSRMRAAYRARRGPRW